MLFLANIFQPLIDVFEAVLKVFHGAGVSWGWAIVLLTVAMRLVLVPLTIKQFRSMIALQRLQPEMKALQNKYKADKQRQQQELMKFYKEHNVNPLGSCLPMVLQLPVFISLYYMLRQSLRNDICPAVQTSFQQHYAAVHHVSMAVASAQTTPCKNAPGASFLFIPDLTNKGSGVVLVVLIVLYVATMLPSTLLMSAPTMDQTQRRLMMIMPLFFVIFIIRFPTGLLVYWITTNAWQVGQAYIMRRRRPPPVVAVGAAGAPGGDGGSGTARDISGGSGTRRGVAGGWLKPSTGNGTGGAPAAGGGLAGLLRGKPKPEEPVSAPASRAAQTRTTAPPRPPRKKKKRSGRRR
jgi:YidC/Oxa1 family membrane protein insertase